DQEGGRPAEQQQAVGSLDRAEQAPALLEHDVAVADGGEAGGREIERRFEIRQRAERKVHHAVEPDLDGEDGDQSQHDEDDGGALAYGAFMGPKSMAPRPQHPHQTEQPGKMNDDGEPHHQGGEGEVADHSCGTSTWRTVATSCRRSKPSLSWSKPMRWLIM